VEDGYLIVGRIGTSTEGGQHNSFLLKTDLSGNVLWYKEHGNATSKDIALTLSVDAAGYITYAGIEFDDQEKVSYLYINKVDHQGEYE